jgi:hypothetical protein
MYRTDATKVPRRLISSQLRLPKADASLEEAA